MNKSDMANAFLDGELAVTLSSAAEVDKLLDALENDGYPTLYRWREFMSDHDIDPNSGVYAVARSVNDDDAFFFVMTLELFLQWLDEGEHMAVKYDRADQIDFI